MNAESAPHHLEWTLLDPSAERPVEVGDFVSTEAGGMPIYRVLAVEGRWVRLADERHPIQELPLERFRWRSAA
ncbi:MAG: hypothetical protein GC203_21500 [Phenylobacterium sp.]|uniref:hypothetical protein n=1 Tax=Phenylobacterium sp. TaxID=1871053 RepID=UPI0025DD01D9|nr:hypothetical protein [Phenylobacterium sp.]MBI1200444.1 hypothetical protein [Phenylobacterium sp.]